MNNADFTEEVGLGHHELEPTFTRSSMKNENMLRMSCDFTSHFIRNTGEEVVPNGTSRYPSGYLDIREANIQEIVEWFEKTIRDWVGTR